ncbi:DgyrCDS3827 [Dimorphilus gyrociliatus]|uniref:DgyrCDS3827 n=1 Tax=Dimorphilus gyrociliatus TaxID=2664684 RepID=A0A7I8VEI5_9ANNE|nr:DgyrCDS3827 [Dimorphilus gyrociliatus]
MDPEKILVSVGPWGRYQLINYILICLAGLLGGGHTMMHIFHASVPKFYCKDGDRAENLTNSNITSVDACYYNSTSTQELTKCKSWSYEDTYGVNIVTKWDLVCDRDWMRATAQSIYMVGFMIGAFSFGQISDKIGRKKSLLIAILIVIIFGSCAIFAQDYWTFTLLRAISGIGAAGSYTVGFVLCLEPIGKNHRLIPGILYQVPFCSGFVIVSGLACLFKNYKHLQLTCSIFAIVFLSYYWIIDESPRWLLIKARYEEAERIFKKIARWNGNKCDWDNLRIFSEQDQEKDESISKASVLDLFKTKNLRKKTINICFQWCVISLTYYGLAMTSSEIKVNLYLNAVIAGFGEFLSCLLAIPLVVIVGRRVPLAFFHILCGTICLVALMVPSNMHVLLMALSQIGRFGICGAFTIIYVFSAELFPTVVRNVGIGVGSFSARIGGLLAPFMTRLDITAALIIFGILSLAASALAILLPDTLGVSLPETIKEGEEFGRKYVSPFRRISKKRTKKDEENDIAYK